MIEFNMRKWFYILTVIVVSIAGFIFLHKDKPFTVRIRQEGSSISGLKLNHSENGALKWELTSRRAEIGQGGEDAHLYALTLNIYQGRSLVLNGKEGIYDFKNKNLKIKDVRATVDDMSLDTDSLLWKAADEEITTEDTINIKGKNFSIDGKGLIIKAREQKVRVLQDVKGIFYN